MATIRDDKDRALEESSNKHEAEISHLRFVPCFSEILTQPCVSEILIQTWQKFQESLQLLSSAVWSARQCKFVDFWKTYQAKYGIM